MTCDISVSLGSNRNVVSVVPGGKIVALMNNINTSSVGANPNSVSKAANNLTVEMAGAFVVGAGSGSTIIMSASMARIFMLMGGVGFRT